MWSYSGITVNHTVFHFVLIFKSVQAIGYWKTRQILSVLVSYSWIFSVLHSVGHFTAWVFYWCFATSLFMSSVNFTVLGLHKKIKIMERKCWKPLVFWCAQLGSTQDPGERIAGSVPSLGLGFGLECHCLNMNRCVSGVIRAVLLQQKWLAGPQSLPETSLRKRWSLSPIQL